MGEANDDLHEHLKNLIEGSTMRWTYAIVWRHSYNLHTLNFQSGYYRGRVKAKEVRILGSCVTVTEEVTDAKSERFFNISKGQSFRIFEDLPGHAIMSPDPVWVNAEDTNPLSWRWEMNDKWETWKRAKWGYRYGIQTFLCIPLRTDIVLELASTEIIPLHPEWVQNMADFIYPIWNDTMLHERKDNEMQNRGKEKISDSKCSWSLLSESSNRDTDETFSNSHDYSGPS